MDQPLFLHGPPPCAGPNRPVRTTTIVVDSKNESIFDLPTAALRKESNHFNHILSSPQSSTGPSPDIKTIRLPNTTTCDFNDFAQYLSTGHILPHRNPTPYGTEYHARRLVRALALGIQLESSSYEYTALKELFHVAANLSKPEDLVDPIFAATTVTVKENDKPHPAKKLIVAAVAAKTSGVVKGPTAPWAKRSVARGERIKSRAFWGMYDEYRWKQGGRCRYPGTLREAIA